MMALSHPPGPPSTIPIAVATALFGAARLAQIRSTTLSGGGSLGGFGGFSYSAAGQLATAGGGRNVEVRVFIEGGFVSNSDDLVREIAEGLEQQMSRAGV